MHLFQFTAWTVLRWIHLYIEKYFSVCVPSEVIRLRLAFVCIFVFKQTWSESRCSPSCGEKVKSRETKRDLCKWANSSWDRCQVISFVGVERREKNKEKYSDCCSYLRVMSSAIVSSSSSRSVRGAAFFRPSSQLQLPPMSHSSLWNAFGRASTCPWTHTGVCEWICLYGVFCIVFS